MKRALILAGALSVAATLPGIGHAGNPDQDLKKFRDYFQNKFPSVEFNDFGNGVYSIDKVARDSWEALEEFPPYEPMIDEGEAMWNKPFANGKSYADCFNGDPAQRQNYPRWDDAKKRVVTLALAINECRKANGEKPLKYKKGAITRLLSYMSYESRGQKVKISIPNADAQAAYDKGRQFYYARRGQLNMACSHCHLMYAGAHIRTETLSPGLGHASGWPVYRLKWGGLGTLHRRFAGCNKQVRAKPFKAQSEEYRNLEYFLTYMSSGIEYNGPSVRK